MIRRVPIDYNNAELFYKVDQDGEWKPLGKIKDIKIFDEDPPEVIALNQYMDKPLVRVWSYYKPLVRVWFYQWIRRVNTKDTADFGCGVVAYDEAGDLAAYFDDGLFYLREDLV